MIKHIGKYESLGYMLDGWVCSCGWKSSPFFDGAEYAEMEFNKHLTNMKKDINNDRTQTSLNSEDHKAHSD